MIFLTGVDRIFVPQEQAAELVRRLGDGAAVTAIAEADDRGVRLTDPQARSVLEVLEDWLQDESSAQIGAELRRLRYELRRDLA